MNYLLIVIFICFSAYFSASEIAFASANERRLKSAVEEKGKLRHRLALHIFQNYERALGTILVGNNLVNIASSAVSTLIVIGLLSGTKFAAWASTISTIVMTIIVLIFGETLPKIIAKQIANEFSTLVSIPLYVMMIITRPIVLITQGIVWLFSLIWKRGKQEDEPTVTEDDLETIIETVEDEGVIDETSADLLQSALDFDDVLAYEIITPRVDMVAIDIDDSEEEIMEIIHTSPYSRIPVYEDTIDNIIGILHLNSCLKDIVSGEKLDLRNRLMSVHYVHKTMPLDDVLKSMRQQNRHIAVVTDEYGGVMGILTMEDVLEQLVGDIWDESDEIVEECIVLGDDRYEVTGDMRIMDFFDEIEKDERNFDDDNITMGGWFVELLGRYPKIGDTAIYENLELKVSKMRKHRVQSLIVTVTPPPVEEDE